jgi:hypothetical protein
MMIRLAIIIIGITSAALEAAEPLRGPEVTYAVWQQNSEPELTGHQSGLTLKNKSLTRQRTLNLDIPIPVALWIAMPFMTVRYLDRTNAQVFASEQKYGVGLLHHAAEGEPAWRLDLERVGAIQAKPAHHTRFIVNLVKFLPSLRLRPSDTTFSWTGLNVFWKAGHKALVIPEVGWTRRGPDGLYVDLIVPKHAFIGFRGSILEITTGVEQELRHIKPVAKETSDSWFIERQARLTLGAKYVTADYSELIFGFSTIKGLAHLAKLEGQQTRSGQDYPLGFEVSMQWVPN